MTVVVTLKWKILRSYHCENSTWNMWTGQWFLLQLPTGNMEFLLCAQVEVFYVFYILHGVMTMDESNVTGFWFHCRYYAMFDARVIPSFNHGSFAFFLSIQNQHCISIKEHFLTRSNLENIDSVQYSFDELDLSLVALHYTIERNCWPPTFYKFPVHDTG